MANQSPFSSCHPGDAGRHPLADWPFQVESLASCIHKLRPSFHFMVMVIKVIFQVYTQFTASKTPFYSFWMTLCLAPCSTFSSQMLMSHLRPSTPCQFPSFQNRPTGVVLTVGSDVEALRRLAQLGDGRNILLRQLDLLKVGADARGRDALGDDRVAADLGPGEDDLGGGGAEALGDGLDLGVLDQQGQAVAVVAESRVGGDVDALLAGVLDEGVVLLEEGVTLDLVGGGDDAGGVDDGLEVLGGEVGDADGAGLGLGELDHS
jgi:hypothetical protein